MAGFGSTVAERQAEKGQNKFRKTEFLSLTPGEHTIRILDEKESMKVSHYVGFSWLECLGEECPICENNNRIRYEHPEDFRDVKGWNPRRDRYLINVLDKTVGDDGKPENKVKVLSRGPTLFEDLSMIASSLHNDTGDKVDVRTYDFSLIVRGEKRDTTITVVPRWIPGREDNPVYEGELFDLDNATIKLEPSEMLDVLNGVSLKDVFAMRRAKKEVAEADVVVSEDIRGEIQDSVDEIFKGG